MVLKLKTLRTRLDSECKRRNAERCHFLFLRRKDTALRIRAFTTLRPHKGNFGYTFGYEKKNKDKKYCGVLIFTNKHAVVVIYRVLRCSD